VFTIGDKVVFVDKRYKDVALVVSATQGERIAVQRKDAHGRTWTAYAHNSELKKWSGE